MADASAADAGTIETRKDEKTPADVVRYWATQEDLARKELADFHKRGRKVVKRYRDERSREQQFKSGGRFNVLWANIAVLKPVLYARTPKPDIAPRWIDTEEEVTRLAATILERTLTYICDRYDVDGVMRSCVEDRLLPGLGIARVRYKPSFGEAVPDPEALEPEEGEERATYKPLESEEVCWEYIFWEDVAWGPCRRWEEMPWLRFRSYMTRDELVERFGDKIGKAVTLDYTPKGLEKDDSPPDVFKKATVYEYWDKGKKEVVWIAPGYESEPLDVKEDPLELDGFYPAPKPLLATTTNDRMIPVPDFVQYQDQADQLDILQARIDKLTQALKVAGVYAGSEKATLQQLLLPSTDNLLIPVEDWAMFAKEKGGLAGSILWLPVKDIAEVLDRLTVQFKVQLERLYEISGLSDIMRGSTEASETATAQRIKSQYGSIRTQDSQKDVGRFARDLFRLAGQVVSKHLDPKTISEMTGLPELPAPVAPPQQSPMAMAAPMGAPPAAPTPQAAPSGPMPPMQPSPVSTGGPGMAQPGAGATLPASGATPPVTSAPDPMAQYQEAAAAFAKYQAEVQQKTEQFAAACELLKTDALRTFRLDIEADSTIAPDEDAEKRSRVEFVTAFATLLQQATPFVQQGGAPAGELVSEVIKFMVHGFRAGRPLEEVIDKFADHLKNLPPAQPHTDPALVKAQGDAAVAARRIEGEIEVETIKAQGLAAREQARGQAEIAKATAEADRVNRETALKEKSAQDDVTIRLAKVEADRHVDLHIANLSHQREQEKHAAADLLERQRLDQVHGLERDKMKHSTDLQREQIGVTAGLAREKQAAMADEGAEA